MKTLSALSLISPLLLAPLTALHADDTGMTAGHLQAADNPAAPPVKLATNGEASPGFAAALAEFVDIYPTLAELCGLPQPKHLEGTSLAPVLLDTTKSVKAAAFSQYPRNSGGKQLMGYTMRTDRYRLTHWVNQGARSKVDAVELYDQQADPQEDVNIANDPKNADLVARLTQQWLKGWEGAKLVK
jgi:arylsulfatase A-like enzyme